MNVDGTHTVSYLVDLVVTGDVQMNNVQMVDDLAAVLDPTATIVSSSAVIAPT